ncbi:MAG: cysteine synthase CysM [Lautropia sp.]|nr:cysteine synthase CysM [Lautropia sp.]
MSEKQTALAVAGIGQLIGNTPMVQLLRLPGEAARERGIQVLGKLEGNNPAGSVKDRPALTMIEAAEARGEIRPGDTLIEATSGNTGIALAMVAAAKGYRMVLVMPENQSLERRQSMRAYGAELVLVSKEAGMEGARDLALQMQADGKGRVLDQFSNDDNWRAHVEGTGPEIWQQTAGRVTHFVSAMGTTGTITGVSRYLKAQNSAIEIIGAQPADGASIPGIRKWPDAYLPAIFRHARVDRTVSVDQSLAEETMRRLALEEGIFCGVSSGGAAAIALQQADAWAARMAADPSLPPAVIVFIVCDRGDRYLSTGVFPA